MRNIILAVASFLITVVLFSQVAIAQTDYDAGTPHTGATGPDPSDSNAKGGTAKTDTNTQAASGVAATGAPQGGDKAGLCCDKNGKNGRMQDQTNPSSGGSGSGGGGKAADGISGG